MTRRGWEADPRINLMLGQERQEAFDQAVTTELVRLTLGGRGPERPEPVATV